LNYIQPVEQNILENKKFLNGNVRVAKIASFLLETGTRPIIVIAVQ